MFSPLDRKDHPKRQDDQEGSQDTEVAVPDLGEVDYLYGELDSNVGDDEDEKRLITCDVSANCWTRSWSSYSEELATYLFCPEMPILGDVCGFRFP